MKAEKFPRGANLQDKVRKLRTLAENNPSVHEGESATAKAEELQARLDSGSRSRNDAKRTLPRGIRRRGDALVVSFALRDPRCTDSKHVPDCDCGKIERRSLGMASVSYAEEQLGIFKRQVREGNYEKRQPKPEKVRPVLVSDLLEPYLRNYRNKGKRAEWRQLSAWEHLKSTFADVPVESLSTDIIEQYIEARRVGITDKKTLLARNGTVNRELSLLRAMLTRGTKVTPKSVHQMPAFPDKLEESPARQGFIKDKEYAVLAANCKPLWLRCLIACAYSFGFRKGELLNLRVRQVDFLGGWLELEQGTTKNDDGRKVYMTTEVNTLMRACTEGKNSDDFVFTRDDGTHVVDPRDDWYSLCVASELGEFVPAKRKNGEEYKQYVGLNLHDFRRSAIRNMDRRGVPQTTQMRISGHRTVSCWRRYNIGDESDLEQATRKIEHGRQVSTPESPSSTKSDTATYAHS